LESDIHDILAFAADQAAAQMDQLDGDPVAAVFLVFDRHGRCSATSVVPPEYLPLLVDRVADAAIDIQAGLRANVAALMESSGQLAAETILMTKH
jgi:hypothetical protein